MKALTILLAALLITACGQSQEVAEDDSDLQSEAAAVAAAEAEAAAAAVAETAAAASRLETILDAMPEQTQARYQYRNPAATLTYFGVMPGMTVVEALPGSGWYSKILLPYLGTDGTLIGVDYSIDMLRLFGNMTEERIESKKTWVEDWTAQANEWRGEDAASVEAFVFGNMEPEFAGRADVVLMIRALHNLNRFEADGGFRTGAFQNAFDVLKPGGILGIVQHEAAADMPDDWADGSNGYLKKAPLIAAAEALGFEFIGESPINNNPADQPTSDDFVWRLPPTLGTSRGDEALQAEMTAIGESNRMTLKFRKPE